MLRRHFFHASAGVAVFCACGSTKSVAEIVLNFPLPNDDQKSRQASALLLSAAATFFTALSFAESRENSRAREEINVGLERLGQSARLFDSIRQSIKVLPLDLGNIRLNKSQVERIVATYRIEIPKENIGLSLLAIREVNIFFTIAKSLDLSEPDKARSSALILGEGVKRLLDVGVFVSALADTSPR